MRNLALGSALLLAGCWQVAIVGDPGPTTGGNGSTGADTTSTGTGTGRATSTGGRTGSGTSSGGTGKECRPCAPGAVCVGGECKCPGDDAGVTCEVHRNDAGMDDELFCAYGTCASCKANNGQLTLGGKGDQCQITLAFSIPTPTCIAVDATSVYWTDSDGIKKVPIIDVTRKFRPLATPQVLADLAGVGIPRCLAIDSTFVYFTVSDNTVREVPLDGDDAGPMTTIATDQSGAYGIAVDRQHVYWTNQYGNQVMRQLKTAAPVEPDLIANLAAGGSPYGIAIDDTNVYWTNLTGSSVMFCPLDGGTPTTIASGEGEPYAITVDDAGNVYWTTFLGQQLLEENLAGPFDGGGIVVLASAQPGPTGIAIDQSEVYWANNQGNSVDFVPMGGGPVRPAFPGITSQPFGVAVDSRNLYWTAQTPGYVYELTPK